MFEAFGTKINGNIVLIGQTANTRKENVKTDRNLCKTHKKSPNIEVVKAQFSAVVICVIMVSLCL